MEYLPTRHYRSCDTITDDDELICDAIIKSGLLEYDDSSDEDDFVAKSPRLTRKSIDSVIKKEVLSDSENETGSSMPSIRVNETERILIMKSIEAVIKKEVLSDDENEPGSSMPSIKNEADRSECIIDSNDKSYSNYTRFIKREIDDPEEASRDYSSEKFDEDVGGSPAEGSKMSDDGMTIEYSNCNIKEEVDADSIRREPKDTFFVDSNDGSSSYFVASPSDMVPECIISEFDESSSSANDTAGKGVKPDHTTRRTLKNNRKKVGVTYNLVKLLKQDKSKEKWIDGKLVEVVDKNGVTSHFKLDRSSKDDERFFWFKLASVNPDGIKLDFVCPEEFHDVLSQRGGIGPPPHSPPIYECFYCRRVRLISMSLVEDHLADVVDDFRANGVIGNYRCKIKSCKFSSPSHGCIELHLRLGHGCLSLTNNVLYPCVKCDQVFNCMTYLKRHYSEVHSIKGVAKFACDLCNFKAVFKSSLNIHRTFAHSRKRKKIK